MVPGLSHAREAEREFTAEMGETQAGRQDKGLKSKMHVRHGVQDCPARMTAASDPSNREAEVGGWLGVQGQRLPVNTRVSAFQ